MNKGKMIEWIGGHDVGISPKTMWCALMGVKCKKDDVPYDADDFSRCYDLYKFAEFTQDDLQKIVDVYPYWKPIVEKWDDLCRMYEQKTGCIYDTLNSMYEEVMTLKGYVKKNKYTWVKQ